jgi:hypothetical protein
MRKLATLLLITVLTVSSLLMVGSAFAQSIPTPSVPEFTVKVADSKAIEATIKNQPFVPYYDSSSGWNISLYYNIRIKGHSEQNWTILYLIEDVPTQSNSNHTILSYPLSDENTNSYILGDKILEFPFSSQVDFQVEAMIGYIHRVLDPNATSQLDLYPYVFTGEESGWSSTQTITIGEIQTSPEPTFSPEPALILGVIAIVAVFAFGIVLLYRIKRK